MFSRISSLRVIERPAKILISRNMGFLNDTIQNIIPFDKTPMLYWMFQKMELYQLLLV